MSLNRAHENTADWTLCPADILLMVFKTLDIKSLSNCMNVNIHWRNLVIYYCDHVNQWKAMVQHGIDDEGVTFAKKSIFGWREQFLSAQQWLNVRKVNVHLKQCYTFECGINYVYVYKDTIIIVTNIGVKYYNIANFKLLKVVDKICIKYEETSSIIAELSVASDQKCLTESFVLTLTNKLNSAGFDQVTLNLDDIDSFKIHLNFCYVFIEKVLWVYSAKAIDPSDPTIKWQLMAKYHGNQTFCSIHIFKNNVYVLFKSGCVLTPDMKCKMFVNAFYFNLNPSIDITSKPFMFHRFSLLFKGSSPLFDKNVVRQAGEQTVCGITMARSGVTCVLEHAPTLILGFEDGSIEIYITRKLLASDSVLPELVISMQTLLDQTNRSGSCLRITCLDIYEDIAGHHLFVSTVSNIYELLL